MSPDTIKCFPGGWKSSPVENSRCTRRDAKSWVRPFNYPFLHVSSSNLYLRELVNKACGRGSWTFFLSTDYQGLPKGWEKGSLQLTQKAKEPIAFLTRCIEVQVLWPGTPFLQNIYKAWRLEPWGIKRKNKGLLGQPYIMTAQKFTAAFSIANQPTACTRLSFFWSPTGMWPSDCHVIEKGREGTASIFYTASQPGSWKPGGSTVI